MIAAILLGIAVCRADPPPLPELITFTARAERVFGIFWFSAGAAYNYSLEVNEDDGRGWFVVAVWESPPKGTVMSGHTFTLGNAIARVRVDRVENPLPTPRGIVRWKVLTPVQW